MSHYFFRTPKTESRYMHLKMMSMCILSQLIGFIPTSAQISFKEVASEVGIDEQKMIWTIGNGVSFVDFTGDGLDDITLGTEVGKQLAFFKNEGGYFSRLAPLVNHAEEAKQVLWVDYDNDGDKDLFVAGFQALNRLYQNEGNLQLRDITESSGLPMEDQYTYGTVWADYDRDGWLDLYFGNHKDLVADKYNLLFRNNRDGTFSDVTDQMQARDQGNVPFCSAFLDFNNDNWPDIYTANDKLTRNTLLMNDQGQGFIDVSEQANADTRLNAMCVAVGDYDNDGWQDIYISNTPSGNALLRNLGYSESIYQVKFEEIAFESGVGFFGNGWGANFLDADNDGDLDLYASGNIAIQEYGKRSSLFYENAGNGTFSVPDAGFDADTTFSFSNAIGDINMDGYPDIFVQNNPPHTHQLWQNQGEGYNWLKVSLEGTLSNRDAIAAKIEIYADDRYQMRFRHCGIGFMGQNSDTEIFGLEELDRIDSLVVTWPSGFQDKLYAVAANQLLQIKEGTTTAITPQPSYQEILFYPNPASDMIFISSPLFRAKAYQLFDIGGKLLAKGELSSFDFSISLPPSRTNLFFLILLDESGRKIGKKILRTE